MKSETELPEMNYFYQVHYQTPEGAKLHDDCEAGNAGTAFALCLKAHPDCTLVKAIVEGRYGSATGHTEYYPPPVQRAPQRNLRAARALNKREKGCEFAFYDEVKVKA